MKNKGFTLVELLSVIVILAIIALIAVPMIMNVIDESRKKAAIISAENYMYAIEQYLVLQEVENYSVKLQNNTTYKVEEDTVFEFSLMDIIVPKVYALPSEEIFLNNIIKIKGEYPKDGYVEIGENKITAAELVSNNYIVTCASSVDCDITGNYISNIVAVQSVEINETEEIEIEAGETLQLSATVLPEDATNKKVTWTSSNNEIATVDENGLVTAKKRGTVTITVTTKNMKTDTIELKIVVGPTKVEATENDTHKGIIYLDPTNLENVCNATKVTENYTANGITENKTGCMKWYIYDDTGDNYTMILDHNTTAIVAWNADNVNVAYENSNLKPLVDSLVTESNWKSTPRLITAYEINQITGKTGWTNTSSWYCLESTVQDSTSSPYCNNTGAIGWLYDYMYCVEGSNDWKCPNNDTATYGYWTSTTYGNAGSGFDVWRVFRNGTLGYGNANDTYFGVRPVITISKSIFS